MEPSISPITLSSSRSSAATSSLSVLRRRPEKCESVISIDSSEYNGHMHLGWKRRNKASKCKRSNSQLSNIQKVANWIKSIEESNIYNVNDVECENDLIEGNDIKSNVLGEKGKGFVVVKCDYMKQLSTQSESCNKHSNTMSYSNCVEKYKARTPRSGLTIPTRNEVKQNGKMVMINMTDKVSLISSADKESYSSSIKFNDEKSDVSSDLCELPKSVEVRKKELCTYLKLMDPSDKKEILALQNRRSTRVRNLAALRERINLEKKIRETTSEILVNDDNQKNQSVSVKQNENYTSNDQLDAIISRTSNLISQNEPSLMQNESFIIHKGKSSIKLNTQDSSNKTTNTCSEKYQFYFPFPPVNHAIQIQNFDNTMEKLIPKFKISLTKKEKSFITNHTLKSNNLSRNKENIQCVRSEGEEKKRELETCNTVSKNNFQNKKPKEISNKIKCKSKSNILSLKGKKQIISKKKLDKLSAKIYNLKLRSTKFKIRLKRVPTENDLMKNKKRIKKSLNNSKFIKNIESKHEKTILIKKIKSSDNLTNTSEKTPQITLQQSDIEPVLETKSKLLNTYELEKEKERIDYQKLQMDVNDFNNLTEEHKKCLIETRLLMSTSNDNESEKLLGQEEVPPLYGFSTSDVNEIKLMCEIFEQSILKHSQKRFKENPDINLMLMLPQNGEPNDNINNCTECGFVEKDPNYTLSEKQSNEDYCCVIGETNKTKINSPNLLSIAEKPLSENCCVQIDPNDVEENNCTVLPYDRNIEIKSLQKSLNFIKKKNSISSPEANICHDWDMDSPKPKKKKLSHFISISKENGNILRTFYVDFNLVICQEFAVSFWMQTPLGNVLGSQDMWIPRGNTQRLMLNNKCIQKESKEMLFCSDTNVAYVELWTKEHKSDIREGPVADIFITIYFWKQRQTGIDKKVLQLENIIGFADDVQYCVMKSLPKIIVSWHVTTEDNIPRTFVHAYQLAPDYQMVSYISEIEPVDHYVSSLHNIEGCDNLIVGSGEKKITLWNVEFGHKIATIELSEMGPLLSTLWVKCDRGFLFAIQQCGNKELRLIAINGINHSWKKLASYFPSEGFEELKGVCIENGLLLSFYDKGILCWKAETGEPVEEVMMDTVLFTCGNHVIFLEQDKVFVRHSLTHLLSVSAEEQ